jgi:GTP-binding protein
MRQEFKTDDTAPKLLMLGNSNVGKSSICRFLLKDKSLIVGGVGKHAGTTVKLKVYKDPQLPYEIVDLPGLGAMTRTGREEINKIHNMIVHYVEKDKNHIFLALIIFNCVRIQDELQKWYYDQQETIPLSYEFVTWLNELGIPNIVIINKIDKVKKSELSKILTDVEAVLTDLEIQKLDFSAETGLLAILPVSAVTQQGMNDLGTIIDDRFVMKYGEQAHWANFAKDRVRKPPKKKRTEQKKSKMSKKR